MDLKRHRVRMPLASAATVAMSHTPLRPKAAVRMNKKAIGNTSVPNNETINDLPGRSIAVKKEEKLISIHPAR